MTMNLWFDVKRGMKNIVMVVLTWILSLFFSTYTQPEMYFGIHFFIIMACSVIGAVLGLIFKETKVMKIMIVSLIIIILTLVISAVIATMTKTNMFIVYEIINCIMSFITIQFKRNKEN